MGRKHDLGEWKALRPLFLRGSIPMTRGPEVMRLRELFCRRLGMNYAVTTSSGTAAIHTALAAVGVGRGDEVITSPLTDMGSLVGILQLNAVPVFADVDPSTMMITPETVTAKLTRRTKAVEVVHFAGLAADVPGVRRVCRPLGVAVIEDCAQSYLCTRGTRVAGTMGDIGCWSMNESKHIGAGDGGILLTNSRKHARLADLFADKCYNREGGRSDPFFAPLTYRLNALAAAVIIEQFRHMDRWAARRNQLGTRLDRELSGIPGIRPRPVRRGDYATYWVYLLSIDVDRFGVTNVEFSDAIRAEGIPCLSPHTMNVLGWSLFRKDTDDRHACSYHCPLYDGGRPDYDQTHFPGLMKACSETIEVPFSPSLTVRDVHDIATAVRKVATYYSQPKTRTSIARH